MLQRFKICITAAACLYAGTLYAQNADSIIGNLWQIHNNIKNQSCANGQVASNRAMNLFLSDRIGYYLSSYKDMSFYKNNITFNAADGIFSLTHNLFQPKGTDEPVKGFMTAGIKTNAANAFAAGFSKKTYSNELGVTFKKTWISQPVTVTNNCFDKTYMDVYREQQLQEMTALIKEEENAFLTSLTSVATVSSQDSNFKKAKKEITAAFYKTLQEKYYRHFAEQQYRELAASEKFKTVKLHWTSFAMYLPVIWQRYTVAGSLAASTESKKTFPFELSLGHTRFWESKKYGRLQLTLEAAALLKNNLERRGIEALSYQEYKNAGGADSLLMNERRINSIYVGEFKNRVTPAVTFSFVYFPHESHIGISGRLVQSFGGFRSMNATLGIPVVLIDKTTAPAADFEFKVHYFDLRHTAFPGKKLIDNLSVSVNVGVPFSKIIY